MTDWLNKFFFKRDLLILNFEKETFKKLINDLNIRSKIILAEKVNFWFIANPAF